MIYDGERSFVSSHLSKIVRHMRETSDILILGYLDYCLSITPSISDVTSPHAIM